MTQEVLKTRRYLNQIKEADAQIKAAMYRIKDIKKAQAYLSGISYNKERVQTSPSGAASFENEIIEIADLEKEARQMIVDREKTKQAIVAQICSMSSPRHISLLLRRYVEDRTNMEIADEMALSEEWIRHQVADALNEFYRANKESIEAHAKETNRKSSHQTY